MSLLWILVLGIGGTLLFVGGMIWLFVWLNRNDKKLAALLQAECARRGWTYAAPDDSVCAQYNDGDRFVVRNWGERILQPMAPITHRYWASRARHVVTGWHRGRPFVAARLALSAIEGEAADRPVIWVYAPGTSPALEVARVAKMESRINAAIGQGDITVGDPEFDDAYQVRSGDPDFARAVLNPVVTAYLKTGLRNFQGYTLINGRLTVQDWLNEHRDPEKLLAALDQRCDVLDRISPSVWAK
ncbi:hypothetical protein [Amycolatopsis benzoatilytica]|uniref:hypothetical protein n=1 Tax=Amycolatopsis benzoatilytica TaxID=346045 RepID=UPI00036A57BE|nr:hypothetical protein [Amycolatopsis benzoatilytica]